MTRVLITGAGGFIGRHLVADQLGRGNEVVALDLHTEALADLHEHAGLAVVEGDFREQALIESHLDGVDVCFHLASAHLETGIGEEVFWQVNVEGARAFVAQCHAAGVGRFVHCSSVGVFGDIKNPPADEESPCDPDIAYEETKLAGEKAVMDYARETGYAVTVLRPAWVYGPGCPRTQKLFRTIEKGRFFFVGDGQTLRHAIFIDDMTRAFDLAAKRDEALHEIFIIAGPRATTLRELAEEIAQVAGVSAPKLQFPKAIVWPGCLLMEIVFGAIGKEAPFTRRSLKFFTGNTAFSTAKAQKLLDFRADVELAEGLRETYRTLDPWK